MVPRLVIVAEFIRLLVIDVHIFPPELNAILSCGADLDAETTGRNIPFVQFTGSRGTGALVGNPFRIIPASDSSDRAYL